MSQYDNIDNHLLTELDGLTRRAKTTSSSGELLTEWRNASDCALARFRGGFFRASLLTDQTARGELYPNTRAWSVLEDDSSWIMIHGLTEKTRHVKLENGTTNANVLTGTQALWQVGSTCAQAHSCNFARPTLTPASRVWSRHCWTLPWAFNSKLLDSKREATHSSADLTTR